MTDGADRIAYRRSKKGSQGKRIEDNLIEWTCARCYIKTKTTRGEFPNWKRVFTQFKEESFDTYPDWEIHLCDSCTEAFREWFEK